MLVSLICFLFFLYIYVNYRASEAGETRHAGVCLCPFKNRLNNRLLLDLEKTNIFLVYSYVSNLFEFVGGTHPEISFGRDV